nr:MAG TPA: hypothetical protein [Caudoviricetes sp.]
MKKNLLPSTEHLPVAWLTKDSGINATSSKKHEHNVINLLS